MVDVCFFFFKQKTAYEMRISDWSSDVCSSDLWLLLPEKSCGEAGRCFAPALFHEGAARKSAALRGWRYGHGRRHSGDCGLAEGTPVGAGTPISPRACADAGFYGRRSEVSRVGKACFMTCRSG